jgi:teichuronic acid biosynthesis glycosyltransferase TuaG
MISIITTVKNGSKYILETLESVKNQTFQEFEHIVVDDGSTDNTVQILEDFQQQNPEYKLFIFQPGNLGRGKALNFAVSKANFDWVAIIDADDIWHPQKLEAQVGVLKKNTNVAVLATRAGIFKTVKSIDFKKLKSSNFETVKVSSLLLKNPICHSSVLIKKKNANYDILRTSQYDLELWYRLTIVNNEKLIVQNEILTFHRIHEDQSFESKGISYRWNAYKLKFSYSLKSRRIYPIIYGLIQFVVGSLVSRIRLILLTKKK